MSKIVQRENKMIPDDYVIVGYMFNKLLEENSNDVERYVSDLDMMFEYFRRNGFEIYKN